MIVGLGLDVCEISRIEEMTSRWGERFLNRVFTAGEREYCMDKVRFAQHLAARFAVKEATLKALGVPKGLRWQEMEVRGGGREKPSLHLSGEALRAANSLGVEHLHLTISHAGDNAVAVVIAERRS